MLRQVYNCRYTGNAYEAFAKGASNVMFKNAQSSLPKVMASRDIALNIRR